MFAVNCDGELTAAKLGRQLQCGLTAGLGGAYYASRIISNFLFEVAPHDAVTLGAVVALLSTAAFFATWLPARRAASIDPVAALRAE